MPAAITGGGAPEGAALTCFSAIDDDERVLGRTSTTCPREATKPVRCARTRYGPGDSVRSSKRPTRSLTANAVVAPSADTIAPATGSPRSSSTTPWIDPGAIVAMCVTGRISGACANAGTTAERQRSIRPPTTGGAVLLDACLICTPRASATRYDGLTVKLISRVSVLFAILSVTLISSR